MNDHVRTARAKMATSPSCGESYVAHISFLWSIRAYASIIWFNFMNSSECFWSSKWLIWLILDMRWDYLFVSYYMADLVASRPSVSILSLWNFINSFSCGPYILTWKHIVLDSSHFSYFRWLIITYSSYSSHGLSCKNFPLKNAIF